MYAYTGRRILVSLVQLFWLLWRVWLVWLVWLVWFSLIILVCLNSFEETIYFHFLKIDNDSCLHCKPL